jgi:hypothetical protein
MTEGRCPHCGEIVRVLPSGLTGFHSERPMRPGPLPCPGSKQNPRALDDLRPTWRDEEQAGTKWDPYAPGYDPAVWAK